MSLVAAHNLMSTFQKRYKGPHNKNLKDDNNKGGNKEKTQQQNQQPRMAFMQVRKNEKTYEVLVVQPARSRVVGEVRVEGVVLLDDHDHVIDAVVWLHRQRFRSG